uniref:PIH1D1/2/3 CS-like domain-containing protein n=1 Tax=Mola mola TaxID=94237 RepID=A0A3Q3X9F3_MOLML
MASTGRANVFRQVSQLWSMLDELCEQEPASYRRFVEKQMKEAAELSAPPELRCCLRTQLPKGSLYVNICSWKRVPAPQDSNSSLLVFGGKLETGTAEGHGGYSVVDVAFNPAVLQDGEEGNPEVCVQLLSFVEKQYDLMLPLPYTVVSCSPKSSPDDLYRRLGFQQRPNAPTPPDTACQNPAALLQQICSLHSEKQDEDTAARIIGRPTGKRNKDLIQVISSTCAQPQEPEHRLEVMTDAAGAPRRVELTVELPKVCSMSDCQLRISEDDILLEVEDLYYLLLEFPQTVNEDTASAIFNRKKRRLTLTVEVV